MRAVVRSILAGLLVGLFVSPAMPQAKSDASEFEGAWHQIASNAGACATCSISIKIGGRDVEVQANNGWSARTSLENHADISALVGNGRWEPKGHGVYDGKPFHVIFRIQKDRLHMRMTVPLYGRFRVIRGVFKKPYLGA